MESQRELNEAEQFQEDMIRCRGIEFARLGMKVEVNGKMQLGAIFYGGGDGVA